MKIRSTILDFCKDQFTIDYSYSSMTMLPVTNIRMLNMFNRMTHTVKNNIKIANGNIKWIHPHCSNSIAYDVNGLLMHSNIVTIANENKRTVNKILSAIKLKNIPSDLYQPGNNPTTYQNKQTVIVNTFSDKTKFVKTKYLNTWLDAIGISEYDFKKLYDSTMFTHIVEDVLYPEFVHSISDTQEFVDCDYKIGHLFSHRCVGTRALELSIGYKDGDNIRVFAKLKNLIHGIFADCHDREYHVVVQKFCQIIANNTNDGVQLSYTTKDNMRKTINVIVPNYV